MYFIFRGHSYDYAIKSIVQIFYKNIKFSKIDKINKNDTNIIVVLKNKKVTTALYTKNGIVCIKTQTNIEDEKHGIKQTIFNMLKEYTGINPKWGILTGIRPTKEVLKQYKKMGTEEDVIKYFKEKFYVSEEKIELCLKIVKVQMPITEKSKSWYYNLYINIPFCPSKCSYCSFTSFSYEKYNRENKVEKYLRFLFKEIDKVEELSKGRVLRSIYIGGGTPTSLNVKELTLLLSYLENKFPIKTLKEYTIEAGRVDTITEKKLDVIKKYGCNRVSINVQTFNDNTLKKIGRTHTKDNFIKVFNIANEKGFKSINVDIILGLEDEKTDDVLNTVEGIIKLNPTNITVHSLAIKKGSTLKENCYYMNYFKEEQLISSMINSTSKILLENGYLPYYLYRQKNTLGNFENVGFTKKGNHSYYNITIIEEKETIIGVGAGATSKIFDNKKNSIETKFNLKGVEEYMLRFDEILERKK